MMTRRPPKPADRVSAPRFKAPKFPTTDCSRLIEPVFDSSLKRFYFVDETLSDAACALTATSTIDHLLKLGIITTFRRNPTTAEIASLFDGVGALSTFDSKIRFWSIIQEMDKDVRHDLNIIRAIRNIFAHSIKLVDFESQKIKEQCYNLRGYQTKGMTPRQKFVASCQRVCAFLVPSIMFSIQVAHLLSENRELLQARSIEMIKAAMIISGTPIEQH